MMQPKDRGRESARQKLTELEGEVAAALKAGGYEVEETEEEPFWFRSMDEVIDWLLDCIPYNPSWENIRMFKNAKPGTIGEKVWQKAKRLGLIEEG